MQCRGCSVNRPVETPIAQPGRNSYLLQLEAQKVAQDKALHCRSRKAKESAVCIATNKKQLTTMALLEFFRLHAESAHRTYEAHCPALMAIIA